MENNETNLSVATESAQEISVPQDNKEIIIPQDTPEKKKKKMSTPLKVILIVLAVLLVLVLLIGVAGAVIYGQATKDTLPAKPESTSDTTSFITSAVYGVLKNETIIVTNEDVVPLLEMVRQSVDSSLGDLAELRELFCIFEGDTGTLYARLYVNEVTVKGVTIKLDKTIPVSANFGISFESPDIVATINDIHIGEISLPVGLVTGAISNVNLPEDIVISGSDLRYSTATLDSMLDAQLSAVISESLGGGDFASLISGLVTDLTDIQISDAYILDSQLVIKGSAL